MRKMVLDALMALFHLELSNKIKIENDKIYVELENKKQAEISLV